MSGWAAPGLSVPSEWVDLAVTEMAKHEPIGTMSCTCMPVDGDGRAEFLPPGLDYDRHLALRLLLAVRTGLTSEDATAIGVRRGMLHIARRIHTERLWQEMQIAQGQPVDSIARLDGLEKSIRDQAGGAA